VSGVGTRSLARERTRLAWRRTALGLAGGAVAGARLLQDVVGPAAWLLALAGLAAALLVARFARRRHESDPLLTQRGGRLVTTVAVGTLLVGIAALVVLLTLATGRVSVL